MEMSHTTMSKISSFEIFTPRSGNLMMQIELHIRQFINIEKNKAKEIDTHSP